MLVAHGLHGAGRRRRARALRRGPGEPMIVSSHRDVDRFTDAMERADAQAALVADGRGAPAPRAGAEPGRARVGPAGPGAAAASCSRTDGARPSGADARLDAHDRRAARHRLRRRAPARVRGRGPGGDGIRPGTRSGRPRRVPVHARGLPLDVPRPALDDAPVRGLRHRRGDERPLPLPARRRARPACRSRSTCRRRWATTPTTRCAEGEVGKVGVAIDSIDDMRTAVRRHPARQGLDVDDDQRHRRRSCCCST